MFVLPLCFATDVGFVVDDVTQCHYIVIIKKKKKKRSEKKTF